MPSPTYSYCKIGKVMLLTAMANWNDKLGYKLEYTFRNFQLSLLYSEFLMCHFLTPCILLQLKLKA